MRRIFFLASLSILWLGCGDGSASLRDAGVTPGADSGSLDAARPDAGEVATGLAAYCEAASDYLDRCAAMLTPCARAMLTECTGTYSVEREEIADARAACGFPETCTSPTSYAVDHCVWEATVDVAPTEAQLSLAQAFCASCGGGEPDCLDQFFVRAEPQEDGSVIVSGIGASYFDYADTVVAQIATRCAPAAGASCHQMFYDCIRTQVEAAQPASVGDACSITGPGP